MIKVEVKVYKDSIIHYQQPVPAVVQKDCNEEEFKAQITKLELSNKQLVNRNKATQVVIGKVRKRAIPNNSLKVGILVLSAYSILLTAALLDEGDYFLKL